MSGGMDMQDSLWTYQKDIALKGAAYLIGYVVFMTAIYSAVDILSPNEDGLFFVTMIVGWILGYLLLVTLIRVSASDGEVAIGGIGGYFGLGLITGIAIGIGFVLLILPGLYLMMRWLPAFARAYVHGDGVSAAMGWSWQQTKSIQGPLMLAMIPAVSGYLVMIILTAGLVFSEGDSPIIDPDLEVIFTNLLTSISTAWLQLLGVAAYRLIEREPEGLVETFS